MPFSNVRNKVQPDLRCGSELIQRQADATLGDLLDIIQKVSHLSNKGLLAEISGAMDQLSDRPQFASHKMGSVDQTQEHLGLERSPQAFS